MHYNVVRQSGYSINIRARAFFASNIENQAFFDPTGGFTALSGMEEENLPIDIFLNKKATQAALDVYIQKNREDRLRFFRFNSTAKHWLTSGALNDLAKRYAVDGNDRSGKVNLPDARELAEVNSDWKRWVHYDPHVGRYTMGIVVKALIQEDWRNGDDAYGRRLAHYRVAKRIWIRRDAKDFLSREFPYKPHWGRYRIHLLAEIIRHLVRACDTHGLSSTSNDHAIVSDHTSQLDFPSPPSLNGDDTFSGAAIDFCFRLFDEELNGNKYSPGARALTRRHGANALAKELLQLMGDRARNFGYPPPYMHPDLRTRFTAECGYTALSLGELKVADRCFEILIEMLSGINEIELLKARLDRSLVKTAAGELAEAEELIAKVSSEVAALPNDSKELVQLNRRIKARWLQVRYHIDPSDGQSLAQHFDTYDKKRRIKEIELLRCFIINLERIRNTIDLESNSTMRPTRYDSLSRCLSDAFTKASEGHHHDAMTLKILLAGILRTRSRNNLVVAEAMLDQVFQDIVAYGCAEITLIRFLLEAGENLAAQGRLYRAYCVYLRRGHRRARARLFVREARQAAVVGLEVLEKLRDNFTVLSSAQIDAFVKNEMDIDQNYLYESAPYLTKEFTKSDNHDPLYGFSMADDHGEERWLTSIDEIEREILEIRPSLLEIGGASILF